MFLEEPRIEGGFAPGGQTGFGDVFDAAIKQSWYVSNVLSSAQAVEEAYDRRIDAVFKATGQRPVHPMRRGYALGEIETGEAQPSDPYGDFDRELSRLAEQFPDQAEAIGAARPVREDARQMARDARTASTEAVARYRGPVGTAAVAEFLGGFAGSFNDPVNTLSMAIGPTGRAGAGLKGLAWMGVKQGAANAAVEAAFQPAVAAWQTEAGLGYGSQDFIANTGMAFAFGFGLDAGVRGAFRGAQKARGRIARLDEAGNVMGYETPQQALDRAARESKVDAVRRAVDGDVAAMRALSDEAGLKDDPEQTAIWDALEDVEATSTRRQGIDPHEDDDAADQAMRHLLDPEEPPPLPPRDLAARADEAAAVPSLPPDVDARIDVDLPADRVPDVVEADAAPVAPPARVEPPIDAERVALTEGRLGILEAADLMRRRPEVVDGSFELRTSDLRAARAIASLSDAAYDMVTGGQAKPVHAQLVARHVADPARHAGLLASLTEIDPKSPAAARRVLNQLMQPGPPKPDPAAGLLDDPLGPEADRQIEVLQKRLGRMESYWDQKYKEETARRDARRGTRRAREVEREAEFIEPSDAMLSALRGRMPPAAEGAFEAASLRVLEAVRAGGVKEVARVLAVMGDKTARDAIVRLDGRLARKVEGADLEKRAHMASWAALRKWADNVEPEVATVIRAEADRVAAAGTAPAPTARDPLAPQPTVAHPLFPGLKLPVLGDGTVPLFRGESPGQRRGAWTHRIYTTDYARAQAFAGKAGHVYEVYVPKERLAEVVPRSGSRDRVTVNPKQSVFTISEDLAAGARRDTETDAEMKALADAPEATLLRAVDEVDALERMADLIEECKS